MLSNLKYRMITAIFIKIIQSLTQLRSISIRVNRIDGRLERQEKDLAKIAADINKIRETLETLNNLEQATSVKLNASEPEEQS